MFNQGPLGSCNQKTALVLALILVEHHTLVPLVLSSFQRQGLTASYLLNMTVSTQPHFLSLQTDLRVASEECCVKQCQMQQRDPAKLGRRLFHCLSHVICHSELGGQQSQLSVQICMQTERVRRDFVTTCEHEGAWQQLFLGFCFS